MDWRETDIVLCDNVDNFDGRVWKQQSNSFIGINIENASDVLLRGWGSKKITSIFRYAWETYTYVRVVG